MLEIINLVAIIIIPVFAVIIGQFLQDRSLKRKEKVAIFKKLMTYRKIGYLEMSCVEALNQVPILFIKNKKIIEYYNNYIGLMNSKNKDEEALQKIEIAKKNLLESMAKTLGYNKINWQVIETPYLPPEIIKKREEGEKFSENIMGLFSNMANAFPFDSAEETKKMIKMWYDLQREELKEQKNRIKKTTK